MNRSIQYPVPSELLLEFIEELVNRDLQATIIGTNEDADILLEIEYEKSETSSVDGMENFLEKLRDEAGIESEE